jgi:hypothetical protein
MAARVRNGSAASIALTPGQRSKANAAVAPAPKRLRVIERSWLFALGSFALAVGYATIVEAAENRVHVGSRQRAAMADPAAMHTSEREADAPAASADVR